MSVREVIQKNEAKLKKTIEAFQHEIASIRTGKATTALLDRVKVEAYGQLMPLKQVGNIGVADVHTLMVQVWDKGMVGPAEKAIRTPTSGSTPWLKARAFGSPSRLLPKSEEKSSSNSPESSVKTQKYHSAISGAI